MKTHLFVAGLAGCLLVAGGAGAQTADTSATGTDPGVGKAAGTFMVRARVLGVIPLNSSSSTSIGGTVQATATATPEVDFSYFATDHIAFELIAATTYHTINVNNSALGNLKVGNTWLLPPSLTVQYHFGPKEAFSPYVGVGVNYSIFYATSGSGIVNNLSLQDNFGAVIQAGVDYNFSGRWFANFDVKEIFLSTKAKLNGGAITAKDALNPVIIGAGIGYRF